MTLQFLLYSCIVYVGILVILFFLKKSLSIPYDRRTLVASTTAIIWIAITTIFISPTPFSDFQGDDTYIIKAATLLIVVLGVNAVVQFVLWVFYALIRSRNIMKVPRFLFNILAVILVIVAFLAGVKLIFNQELNGLLVTSTVLSAIIGLALQSTLSNLFAGFALQVESPFSIDDWVNLGGHEGKVVSQNWRSITILTRENHRISLTNSFVADDKVINFSRPTRRQVHNFYIALDYSHPPNKVKKILEDLMNEIEEVDLDTRLGAFVVDYLDSGIKYCMKYWLHDYADIMQIQDVVLTRLWYKLDRHNIKIPYPITEVQHIQLEDNGGEVNKIDTDQIITFLSKLEWLEGMQPKNISKLVTNGQIIRYAKDDLIVEQERKGDSMFVVIDGSTRVLLRTDKGGEVNLADKNAGDFFGEMSLLTGELRSASIRANTDSTVLKIDKASFSNLIATDEHQETAYKAILNKVWKYLKNPT